MQREGYFITIVCFEHGTFVFDTQKGKKCYEWGKKEYKPNHLLFMDDWKLFSKSEEQKVTLVKTVYVFCTDIGMEFGMKCNSYHEETESS